MSGTVGIIAGDSGRYTMFSVHLSRLTLPVNTAVDWVITSDIVLGRNKLVERSLERGSEWLFFLDDDHVFGNDILVKLLEHDKPVVGALYLQRQTPFSPVAYSERIDDKMYVPLDLANLPKSDLIQVCAVGTGGMLVRSEVFRDLGEPWFKHGGEVASEDMIFCDRIGALGYEIYCDLNAKMGHLTVASVWPSFTDESWHVGFAIADGFSLKIPAFPHEVVS